MEIHYNKHDHFEITDALRNYTEKKLDRVMRHFDKITRITVSFDVENLLNKVEATIHLPGKNDLHARSESENMYSAIDVLIDKLDRQIVKHKEMLKNHHRES